MNGANKVVRGLWIGPELSVMERLSISSFLQNGHEYHLYVYDDVKLVPAGAVVKDANEILPSRMIFQYRDHPSYAGFSNFFRYKLLLEKGGWWADTDVICLQPFDFEDDYVIASQRHDGRDVATSGIIKAPAGSDLMGYAWRACQARDPASLAWGETGPVLMERAVSLLSLDRYRQRAEVFCPLDWQEWSRAVSADAPWPFGQATFAVHLWNEMWRRAGLDKNGPHPAGCPYERLKARYLPQ